MSSCSINVVLFALIAFGAIVSVVNAKPPSRLNGGHDASPGQYTWVVGIVRGDSPVTECGGAIISPRHILTAAHCVYGFANTFRVRSGHIDVNHADVLFTNVSRYVAHPAFKPESSKMNLPKNDIAILVLEEDLPIDDKRSIVVLPSKQWTNQYALFAGWGLVSDDPTVEPTTLQAASVKVMDDGECLLRNGVPKMPQFICGYQPYGYTHEGDSGSPLVFSGEVIGIASGGYRRAGVPDNYVNVYHYNIWIRSVLAKNE